MADDEEISHPTMELYRHTALRGANLGACLSLMLAPPYLLIRGVRSPMEILKRTGSITAKGTAVGMAFGIIITIMKTYNNLDEQIYDRSYRIRHNEGQVRTDKFTYGGIALGGIAGVAGGLSSAGPALSLVQGASMGVGLAVLAHILTKPKNKCKSKDGKKTEKTTQKKE